MIQADLIWMEVSFNSTAKAHHVCPPMDVRTVALVINTAFSRAGTVASHPHCPDMHDTGKSTIHTPNSS